MANRIWWLAPLPLLAAAALKQSRRRASTLTVRALGQHRARPDSAVVELGIEAASPEIKEAYIHLQIEAERVRARLRASGFAPEPVQWGQFQLQPVESGFLLRASAELHIPELRMLDPLVAALSAEDLQSVRGISFRLRDTAAAEQAAVAEACRNAQRKAVALARDLGSVLGPVQAVRMGRVRGARQGYRSLRVAAEAAPFAPQELTLAASVTAVYRLGP